MKIYGALILAVGLFACGASDDADKTTNTGNGSETGAGSEETPGTPSEEVTPEEDPQDVWEEQFGDDLEEGVESIEFSDLVARAAELNRQEFITQATVRASCTKRGCWMELRPTDDRNGTGITVRFKNYGFFVPLNSRGAEVKLQFVVNATQLTAEQVAAFEAEGGVVSNKQEDGSASVVELTASGVLMRGRKK